MRKAPATPRTGRPRIYSELRRITGIDLEQRHLEILYGYMERHQLNRNEALRRAIDLLGDSDKG